MASSQQAPNKVLSSSRQSLFYLFCACVVLIVIGTIAMMNFGYVNPIKFPSVSGIYDKIQSLNVSYLTAAANQIPCQCPPCVTYAPCLCKARRQECPTPPSCPPRKTTFLPFKRDVARRLGDINTALLRNFKKKQPPEEYLLLKLEALIAELDMGYKHSKIVEVVKEMPKELKSDEKLDVCPEKYLGEKKGYPFFQTGWVKTNCTNVKPLPEVITVLLNTVEYPKPYEGHIEIVLNGIASNYPGVHVYMAPKNEEIAKLADKFQNVTAIKIGNNTKYGKIWNQLVSMVKTPYTLVGRDLVHFNWMARLERQIRMIYELEHVGIVGGSFRNWTGHWRIGCRQTKKRNYVLEYEEGYYYSARSCMFCDDLEGPFVSKTEILRKAEFGEKLPTELVFEDFFLRVLETGYFVMNCPDAMYFNVDYTTERKRSDPKIWRFFASKWIFVRIILPGEVKHVLSCQDIGYRCRTSVTKYALMPACCLEQYGRALKFFHNFCERNNVLYELDAGSVLAAVKFRGFIPWDLDGDMSMSSYNFSFVRKHQDYFRNHGFNLNGYSQPKWVNGTIVKRRKGYLVYHSPDIYTEINGWPSVSGSHFAPPELQDPLFYTKCLMNGYWVNCMYSPGLFARNRYGLDVLKHSQSWLQVGNMGSSWSRYKPGRFLPCKYPYFHACLDKFPADGNLPFMVT
ncbi:uncharacterized protein LOC116617998 [Nematostella vectensis]|uniref:uncharacterized protein LOC116617998 n=1 Tax=Nematostella vectensis TaxID=45351 RepID=UPI00139012F1|nr:uncharacterized protein LOC116617998 [Nematostella vectensis]